MKTFYSLNPSDSRGRTLCNSGHYSATRTSLSWTPSRAGQPARRRTPIHVIGESPGGPGDTYPRKESLRGHRAGIKHLKDHHGREGLVFFSLVPESRTRITQAAKGKMPAPNHENCPKAEWAALRGSELPLTGQSPSIDWRTIGWG